MIIQLRLVSGNHLELAAADGDVFLISTYPASVTDSASVGDRAVLNDNDQSWVEFLRATDLVSLQRVPAAGEAYSLSRYPYAAMVSPSTHTDVKVMNYEEILGTENQ